MKGRQRVAPIFLPHAGCPFRCVYCNQFLGTGGMGRLETDPVQYAAERLQEQAGWAQRAGETREIAFFGGTFTALPHDTIVRLLEMASYWVCRGVFAGIRFSTRPDAISEEVCDLLANFPVRTVELGVQSLSDPVLQQSRRGYGASVAAGAAQRVCRYGWKLGIQLMPGLPGDTHGRFLSSLEEAVDLKPDFLRLYPTLVLEGTALADWYLEGRYVPLTLEEAISWCAEAYEVLRLAGVALARAGLHGDVQRGGSRPVLAGPFHPAFGYLVRVRWWRNRVDTFLSLSSPNTRGKRLTLVVPAHRISEALGPGQSNPIHWRARWALREIRLRGVEKLGEHELEVRLE